MSPGLRKESLASLVSQPGQLSLHLQQLLSDSWGEEASEIRGHHCLPHWWHPLLSYTLLNFQSFGPPDIKLVKFKLHQRQLPMLLKRLNTKFLSEVQ